MQLVIETALMACSVALIDGERVVAERHEEIGRGHAERLIPMIETVLAEAGGRPVTAILVDVGPGSFTGLRVGIAAAKALAFAWNVPIGGVASTELVAAGAFSQNPDLPSLYVALDAARGQVYAQAFRRGGPATEIQALDPAVAARQAATSAAVAGTGAPLLMTLAADLVFAAPALPRASDARFLTREHARPATPLYIRAPDARLPA